MEFLKREFEGVPDGLVELGLHQLEKAIRDIRMQDPSQLPLTSMELCCKIRAVMDFLAAGRRRTENRKE